MNQSFNKVIAAMLSTCVVVLTACSGGDQPATLDNATSTQNAQASIQQKQSASVAKGDPSVSLDHYTELSSGNQLMFSYLAIANLPIDYEKIAGVLSQKYRYENDEFKKRDLLAALKPQIDQEVSRAKEQRYYRMEIGDQSGIGKYDFDTKSFAINCVPEASGYRYFMDNAQEYHLSFSNGQAFRQLKVSDENLAREIESLRSKYNTLSVEAYFFVNDSKIGQTEAIAQIMKLRISDRRGKVLAEI